MAAVGAGAPVSAGCEHSGNRPVDLIGIVSARTALETNRANRQFTGVTAAIESPSARPDHTGHGEDRYDRRRAGRSGVSCVGRIPVPGAHPRSILVMFKSAAAR